MADHVDLTDGEADNNSRPECRHLRHLRNFFAKWTIETEGWSGREFLDAFLLRSPVGTIPGESHLTTSPLEEISAVGATFHNGTGLAEPPLSWAYGEDSPCFRSQTRLSQAIEEVRAIQEPEYRRLRLEEASSRGT